MLRTRAAALISSREAQLRRAIPDALTIGKTMLYVGAKPARMQMFDTFSAAGYEIDILEGWRPNVDGLLKWNAETKKAGLIIKGDARQIDFKRAWDIVMWWHGPEHVAPDEVPNALRRVETATRKLVILACPFGRYPQDDVDGNPFERHLSHLVPQDFRLLGYEVDTLGVKDQRGSNVLAWKRIA